MLDLQTLIDSLPVRPSPDELLASFIPPPRFAAKRFEGYHPRHPTQSAALERLERLAAELRGGADGGVWGRVRSLLAGGRTGSGTYLDGGFGVGKTHLLASLWHAAPGPKTYLSFDELMYFIGLLGVGEARAAFASQRLVAVDEWELDDPGNLKMALAWLRGVIAAGAHVAVTSNTLPLELGQGRFSQKDFTAEIEELAAVFEVVRVAGEDYRHRHFEADPGREYFLAEEALERRSAEAGPDALHVAFPELLSALQDLHPIRYSALAERIDALLLAGLSTIESLPDALRWVHFVDTLYDSAVPLEASSSIALSALFPSSFLDGPFGKKMSRCLSRLEEMLTR